MANLRGKDARTLTSVALHDLRKRVVAAVRADRSYVDVASTFGLSRQAVARWAHAAERRGVRALKPKQKGRPKGGKLTEVQSKRVIKMIIKHVPDQLRLPFFLWTREAIALLIKRRFRITLSAWTVGRWLKRWGLTPQKPARRAYERDPKRVKEWLKKEYPKIRAMARREKAVILWEDEMGLRSDSSVSRTYCLRGRTPIVPVPGQRFSCNMIAGLSNRGKLFFMIFTETFTAPIFLIFLRRLVRQVQKKVFLIADAHPAHRAGNIYKWLAENKNKVRIFFIPPYSPDLNPTEYLNQDVKTNALRRKRPKDKAQLIANVRAYLRKKQRKPERVASYFHAKPVLYASR